MDGEAVKEISALGERVASMEIDGLKFARTNGGAGDFTAVRDKIYRPAALNGQTLSGLVDFIKSNRDKIDLAKSSIMVNSFDQVTLFQAVSGYDNGRSTIFVSRLDSNLPKFKFEQYMSIEEFIIKTRALFQKTGDLDEIISIISKVTNQNEIKLNDDGISQELSVKRGVSGGLKDKAETNGIYKLAPFRTFREIKQPESSFILRLKSSGEDSLPTVALFDAEGEIWRYQAVLDIRDYLKEALGAIDIPVIA